MEEVILVLIKEEKVKAGRKSHIVCEKHLSLYKIMAMKGNISKTEIAGNNTANRRR